MNKNPKQSDIPAMLKERRIFRSVAGTPLEATLEGELYVLYSYGEPLGHVNCVTGEKHMSVRPEHKTQAKHWDLVNSHVLSEPGYPVYRGNVRTKPVDRSVSRQGRRK